jgi:predicted TIM-barrel fold metal-dependent hydrolase
MYAMDSPASKLSWTDSHFHLFAAGQGQPGARYVPAYDATFDAWRAAIGAVGVGRGVLVQPSFLGTDNTRLCAELQAHPRQLRGVAVVAPDTPADTLRELHGLGVRGIRLNLAGVSHDVSAWAAAHALWDALLRLGWHVELHTDVGALAGVLARLPGDLPVVVDHMAKPATASASDDTIAALRRRAASTPVHVKLSGAYRLQGRDAGAVARVLLGELGECRLLWGSDWPCTNHEDEADGARLIGALHEWVGETAAAAALGRNPERLYWGDPD